MNAWANGLVVMAGLFGAAGVAAAAGAAHGKGGPDLAVAANFLLFHAAAICAIALSSQRAQASFLAAATLIAIGALLFCGDLSTLGLTGHGILPLAAPTGGLALILGWLGVAAAGAARVWKH